MSDLKPTVFVVDDDPSVLRAIARLLAAADFKVAPFDSAQEFLDQHDPATPGCVVLDFAMPGLNGLEVQEALSNRGATRAIIFLTGHGDIPTSVRAMKQGAVDFLTKPVREQTLLPAVRTAMARDQALRRVRDEVTDIRRRLATLTPREYEVLQHVVAGDLNKETAATLGTGEKTIKVHRGRMMGKMQVNSVAELARLAERAGISEVLPTHMQHLALDQSPIASAHSAR